MNSLLFRRKLFRTAHMRKLSLFSYPHTLEKINPKFINLPANDKYADIQRTGLDEAPLAYQNTRKFPEWYKPYMINYEGHGYILLYFFMMSLFGYTFLKEIASVKGRKSIKVIEHDDCPTLSERNSNTSIKQKIDANDENYTKYLEGKPRTYAHH